MFGLMNRTARNENFNGRHDQCDYQQMSNSLWYRFGGQAGIKIATSCVGHGNCGTAASGWMLGSHPTFSEGKVNRTVCYRSWYNNCCWQSNSIEVLNCGNYLSTSLANHLVVVTDTVARTTKLKVLTLIF